MIEYLKIETPFERDVNGTKKLIEGKFRNETVECRLVRSFGYRRWS